MKKTTKFLIAGAVLLLSGAIIFAIAMSALKWDFEKLDSATYEAKTFAPTSASEQITDVKIDVDSFPVNIRQGETLNVNYYESNYSEVSVEVENGVLNIIETRHRNFFVSGWFNLGTLTRKYDITVPGSVNVQFDGTNGNVTLDGINSESVVIKATNTVLKLRDCRIDNVDVHSTNADVEFEDCRILNAELRSTNLDIIVVGCDIDNFAAHGTNCDFVMRNGDCAVVQVTATNNDVEIRNVSVNNLTLKGTNLDAELALKGSKAEYTIISKGKRLPAQQTGTTDKIISLSGTNNDVELKFL